MASYMQIKARKAGTDQLPLVLTFTNRKQFNETHTRFILRDDIEIVDVAYGYKLFTSADEAEEEFDFWAR